MNKKDKSVANKIFMSIIGIVLLVYSLTIVFVLCWGLLTSFKSVLDFNYGKNVMGLPNLDENVGWNSRKAVFEWANYSEIFRLFPEVLKTMKKAFYVGDALVSHRANPSVFGVFGNTFLYVVIGPLLQTLVPAIMAYATAKHDFKICKLIYGIALFSMIMPIVGNYTSAIDLLRNLGLYDTWPGFFVQKFYFGGMYFLVFHAFYKALANSYSEAAEIDGASKFKQFLHITVPLLKSSSYFIFTTTLIGSFQLFDLVYLLGLYNNYNAITPVVQIYLSAKELRFGYGSAMACILFIVIMIITVITQLFVKENDNEKKLFGRKDDKYRKKYQKWKQSECK